MTAGWGSRTVRAAVFAAVCVLLAALGHVLMSGGDVPAWTLAAGAVATVAVGWALAGRERGLVAVVTVVVAAQTVLHESFSLAQSVTGGGGEAAMDMGSAHMGSLHMGASHVGAAHMDGAHMGVMHMDAMDMSHHMGAADMGVGATTMAGTTMAGTAMGGSHMGVTDMVMDGTHSSLGMLAAHLLAALLTGLWLAYGEKAAFRILRAVAARLAAPLRLLLAAPVAPARPRLRPRRPRSDRAPVLRLLVHAITSRGPPVGTAVL
ncbi:hypothetical protein ACIPSE_24610 [Streptomyces sp. NPDC090106]|uniref:hypothetical protein n=1 Tax=Streptomyces sp. NPDC090106 TaxID=3365946 RepID=UPI0037FE68E0